MQGTIDQYRFLRFDNDEHEAQTILDLEEVAIARIGDDGGIEILLRGNSCPIRYGNPRVAKMFMSAIAQYRQNRPGASPADSLRSIDETLKAIDSRLQYAST